MKENEGIAVVGIGGIFPGASDLQGFWASVRDGVSASREVPAHRWAIPAGEVFTPPPARPDKAFSNRGCFIEDSCIDETLQQFCGDLSPEMRKKLDPLYLVTLAAGKMAFNDAVTSGLDLSKVGVILGNIALPTEKSSALAWEILGHTFEEKLLGKSTTWSAEKVDPLNGNVTGLPAGFLARALNLGGGCHTLDAACASSLYAIKLAVDELQSGRCDAMLCGGVSRPDCLYTQMGFSQLNALSPDGICAPFDEKGRGLVIGEGAGIMVIKRLEDAQRAGDRIYGVIRSIGLSNDMEGSLLAPSTEGQLRSMKKAYKKAQWSPDQVDIIECHATGTPVGDAVELESLNQLWRDVSWKEGQCVIGSVKGNIGHLLTGAGAAGMIKILLALKEKTLPPTAGFSHPAPAITLKGSPFRVLSEPEPWKNRKKGVPRKAAVSAFGFGGINAHVLIEEYQADSKSRKASFIAVAPREPRPAVAIVGIDACYGPLNTLEAFCGSTIHNGREEKRRRKNHNFGVEESPWFLRDWKDRVALEGFGIDQLTVMPGKFRIPPRELQEMLPQQLLMLLVASRALDDAGEKEKNHIKSGVFIGIAFDFNTTNFHIRWSIVNKIREWADALGLDPESGEPAKWKRLLRDASGPPLTANRTMGALGSIVASRIAREFHFGGPSFTVSSEQSSGLKALETAVRRLQSEEIDCALAGAVDMAADIRKLITLREIERLYRPDESDRSALSKKLDEIPFGEGSSAVVLKRLTDAERDGNRIYAIIQGMGNATGGERFSIAPARSCCEAALQRAYDEAGGNIDLLDYLEIDGAGETDAAHQESLAIKEFFGRGNRRTARHLGSIKAHIGDSGAAGSLAALVRACLALREHTIPLQIHSELINSGLKDTALFSTSPYLSYWLRNRAEGARRAGVNSMSIDGNSIHVVLEGYEKSIDLRGNNTRCRSYPFQEALFVVKGGAIHSLTPELKRLQTFLRESSGEDIRLLAKDWYGRNISRKGEESAVVFVSDRKALLNRQIEAALTSLERFPERTMHGKDRFLPGIPPDSVFFTPDPLCRKGKIAFVFPGSGNCYPGMGRELSSAFPHIMERQDKENEFLEKQIMPEHFWYSESLNHLAGDLRTPMVGQVALCTVVSDIVRSFNVNPQAVLGYSLGEMAGLFSLRAWKDRDLMLERMEQSRLFTEYLAGQCLAARNCWRLQKKESVEWAMGVVDLPAAKIREALSGRSKVYLLIINTQNDCVVGGERESVEKMVEDLGCAFLPVEGVTTVHCEVVKSVSAQYRAFHLFPTTQPPGVSFYSTGWGRRYELSMEHCADAILAQAVDTLDFPAVVESAWQDGARLFIETGPGSSCTRMINTILANRPHSARSVSFQGTSELCSVLRLLGNLTAEGVPVNLDSLYGGDYRAIEICRESSESQRGTLSITVGAPPFKIPELPGLPQPAVVPATPATAAPPSSQITKSPVNIGAGREAAASMTSQTMESMISGRGITVEPVMKQFEAMQSARLKAHEAYLNFTRNVTDGMERFLGFQVSLLEYAKTQGFGDLSFIDQGATPYLAPSPVLSPVLSPVPSPVPSSAISLAAQAKYLTEFYPSRTDMPPEPSLLPDVTPRSLNREKCMDFAIRSIADVLGPAYSEIDTFPTRVRLPDEPLMLVDRILSIEGEPLSMSGGKVVTEHDILPGAWYLDCDRIPTCIAVEAGQADLFLSGFLGIDLKTRGLAVYRLLDAEVTFHRPLPGPGEVIHYEIQIERFFTQGTTWLFKFRFDSTVSGELLLTMRNGSAGFFTAKDLDEGRGIVHSTLDRKPQKGKKPDDWTAFVPVGIEAYSDAQVDMLRKGDLEGCFGPLFAGLGVKSPLTIPGGLMKLVYRVLHLNPEGGRFGLGIIHAEADIHPDDWFLTCHFCDDNVMPGTLMYECCFHTLRIFLLRMGWVPEKEAAVWEPVKGVRSQLKCRGQVIATTKRAAYEISIRELGYNPAPYAIADALMYADGKPVVEITNMSVQLTGLTKDDMLHRWQKRKSQLPAAEPEKKKALYDNESILDFAVGRPSRAFGEPYRIFDRERVIARLPGPPYKFLDRITGIAAEPWKMVPGGTIEAQYDVPPDEWYFASYLDNVMPFAVLLEVALQPCGWLAAYMGSALTSEIDLSFRNLGGTAVLYRHIRESCGVLVTRVKATSISTSGGMIIQHYSFQVLNGDQTVYEGTTYFGFFSKEALANQVGIRDARIYLPAAEERGRGQAFEYPCDGYPFPDSMLSMIDQIELIVPDGGPHGLGYIQGSMAVKPDAWFFKAHFFQDPVIPGSLGIESFLQVLRVAASRRWGRSIRNGQTLITPVEGYRHEWVYRGQILSSDRKVTVDAWITSIDEQHGVMRAEGYLSVDGRIIYHMKDFSLRM
ncbi:MAG: beta-ketoacyl synthase N-terminal-like domain-containing protein [Vulcanimicrobiota bacterium]